MDVRSKKPAPRGFDSARANRKSVQPPSAITNGPLQRAIDLHLSGDFDGAESLYSSLLESGLEDPLLYSNLAGILTRRGRTSEAIKMFSRSLKIDPANPDTCNNLGVALKASGRMAEAVAFYQRAIAQRPFFPAAHRNLAYALLQCGDYVNGWREHEWRLHVFAQEGLSRQLVAAPPCPRWDGKLDASIHLLVVGEQGLGDMLQFARYVPFLRDYVGQISLCVPEKLVPLLKCSGLADSVCGPSAIPEGCDVRWLPLMSLPFVLEATPRHPPSAFPYLRAPQDRLNYWNRQIRGSTIEGPIIGINWQGNPKTEDTNLQGRSFPLEFFSALAVIPRVRFISLQKGPGSEQLQDCSFRHLFVECQDEISACWNFLDAAAIAASCHLVITCDTALAHLSGALGRPTWILLQKYPDWRWGLNGSMTDWYPAARLFRQSSQGDWDTVFDDVLTALKSCLQHV